MEATLTLLGWRQGIFVNGNYRYPGMRSDAGVDVWRNSFGVVHDARGHSDQLEDCLINDEDFFCICHRCLEISNAAA